MSAWPSPLLWSLTTACLTGIALGQTTTTTQVPTASTPAPASESTTQVPIPSSPVPPSATATTASAPPTATAALSAGVVSAPANLVVSTATADPSTNPPAQTLLTTTGVTVLTSGSTATSQAPTGPMAASTSTPVSLPGVTTSPGVPSAAPFPATAKPSNCSGVNVTACAPCSPGTFPNNGTLSCSCCMGGSCIDPSACTSCPLGHYQPESGQQSCLPCPQGHYTNIQCPFQENGGLCPLGGCRDRRGGECFPGLYPSWNGRSDQSWGEETKPGCGKGDLTMRFTRSITCLPCLPGHYANESGAAACRACEKGYFSSKENAAFCLPCLPGSFCNTTSCTVCLPCPGGQEALQAAAGDCMLCSPGTVKGPSDNKCKLCRTGEYQLQWGKESCDLCPENHYCPSPDVNPVKCPPDAFCPTGSAEPAYCMELFLYKAGDSCQLTPLMVVLLAIFSAGGILAVFLIILRRRQQYSKKTLKSLLLPQGSGRHTTYGGTEHTEPVYAGW